jgi:hypothetical protein
MSKVLAEQKIALEMGDYLKLLPHKHQTDGFFAAVFERKPMPKKPPRKKRRMATSNSLHGRYSRFRALKGWPILSVRTTGKGRVTGLFALI